MSNNGEVGKQQRKFALREQVLQISPANNNT